MPYLTISVIIPCFNAEPFIQETLQSVLNQGINGIEIIVIDDGSTDNSALIVEKQFPSVRSVRTENQGPSKARNLGTKLSKGEFIQYLDADDLLAPGKLKVQSEALQESGADIAYGNWQKLIKTAKGDYIEGEIIIKKLQNPEIDLFIDFWHPPAAYLFRRTIVEKIGGFKENLPIIQDARFALDCSLQGGRFVYCEGIMAYYRMPSVKSVSRQDPVGFNRDCLRNAIEIEEWWENHDGINDRRKRALLKVYGYVARASFEKDKETFEAAYQNLERLKPGYMPERPWHLRIASWLFGYRNAEGIALWYRNARRKLQRG